jgi:hypothetical protein
MLSDETAFVSIIPAVVLSSHLEPATDALVHRFFFSETEIPSILFPRLAYVPCTRFHALGPREVREHPLLINLAYYSPC